MQTNNKIFIIDSTGGTPTFSGDVCPVMANIIESCDSDTSIELNSGDTVFNKTIVAPNISIGNIKEFDGTTDFYGKILLGNDSGFTLTDLSQFTGSSNTALTYANLVAALGYVPEDVANKVSNFTSGNTTNYPSTQGVINYIDNNVFDTFITGGTYTSGTSTLSLNRNDATTLNISGITVSRTTPQFVDSYNGTRLTPLDSSLNGFMVNKSINGNIGLRIINQDVVGNGSISAVVVGGTGSNTGQFSYHGPNYFVSGLRNTTVVYSNIGLNIMAVNNNSINFRTGTDINATTRFSINSGGTLNIAVTPITGNSNNILVRNTNGNIEINNVNNLIGYIPENISNKVDNFNIINNNLYPTVEAVRDFVLNSGTTNIMSSDNSINVNYSGNSVDLTTNDIFIVSGYTNNYLLNLINNDNTNIIVDLENVFNIFNSNLKYETTINSTSFNFTINQIEHGISKVNVVQVYNPSNNEVSVEINNNNNNITVLSNIDLINHKIIIS